MMNYIVLRAALLFGLAAGVAVAQTATYRTLTPSGAAPHPAVLLVPGCSGFTATNGVNPYDERAADLQAAGNFVVFVDYVGRWGNCAHISHDAVGEAIRDAAAWAREQPGIDPNRIAVIGWSYGGGGVLAALHDMPAGTPVFTRAVLYYPDCRAAKPWRAPGLTALLLLGASDDVALPELCDPVVQGAPPDSLRTITYPGALHAFDVRSLPERTRLPFGTIGYNAAAAAQSWTAVRDFLK